MAKGRRQYARVLALLASGAAGAPGMSAEQGGECVADSDCVAVLCPCNWIPISKKSDAALTDCRVLQEISRCGSVTPDGRPAVACRAGVCRDAGDPAPDASPRSPRAVDAPLPHAISDDADWRELVDSGALYDGMPREHAVHVLGEPALESARRIEWRRSPTETVSAAKRGSRLYDWRAGAR